jgi:hypothetical protein
MSRKSTWIGLAGLTVVCACASVPTDRAKLVVQVPAALDRSAPIDDAVKRVCSVELTVGVQVFDRIKLRMPNAVQARDPGRTGQDLALGLTILRVGVQPRRQPSHDAPQNIVVRADLSESGTLIASEIFERDLMSLPSVPPAMSTCNYVERMARELGQDIAGWLAKAPRHSRDRRSASTAQFKAVDKCRAAVRGESCSPG